jgi:hypothetical protein
MHDSDHQALGEKDKPWIIAAEMKFVRERTKYMLFDQKKYHEILTELTTQAGSERIVILTTNGHNMLEERTESNSVTLL